MVDEINKTYKSHGGGTNNLNVRGEVKGKRAWEKGFQRKSSQEFSKITYELKTIDTGSSENTYQDKHKKNGKKQYVIF